jgi:hypothetical protein
VNNPNPFGRLNISNKQSVLQNELKKSPKGSPNSPISNPNIYTQWDYIFPTANNMHCLPYIFPDEDEE